MGTPAKKPEYLFQFTEAELADWWNYAACMDHPQADDWFAEGARGAEEASRAIALCKRCPVQTKCLSYAMGHPEVEGIWGGLTAPERRVVRKSGDMSSRPVVRLCARGHDQAVHGTVRPSGSRHCRACQRHTDELRREKRKRAA